MEMLLYIGKVNLYWILLFACYRLMLRKHTFFQWNRIYLLGSILAAFALPFVIYPETAPPIPTIYEVNTAPVTFTLTQEEQPLFTWIDALWLVYGIGLAIAAFHLLRHIFQLRTFLKSGEVIELEDCTVVMTDSNHVGSFSFLKWIVINRNDYESHFDDILCHEMVHTRQWHSADILFVEVMKVFFWFNPILLLYKRDLQEVHEFLADSKASNRENYARFLVSYALNAPIASLTNHFFKPSQIKSRIQMIYKNRSPKWLLSTYLFATVIIGATALLVAGCEKAEYREPATAPQEEEVLPQKVFTVVEKQPEYPGGTEAMFKFLAQNIRYPSAAAKAKVQGRIFLSFIVTETGEIMDVKVLKGLGFGCDEEAVRVLKSFPKWKPGEQNGHKVNVRYNLPVNFEIEETGSQANVNLKNKGIDKEVFIVNFQDTEVAAIQPTAKEQQLNPKPGSGIQIRVDPSVSLAKAPLYIVDGVKQGHDIGVSKVDPNNIESVNVLKEASATAVYGEEGKNGIVLITTRKK
jgi:TonB family protein